MSGRDNTIDRFLNSLSRVISNPEVYKTIGLELGFAQYELDGRWTNSYGNVHLAAGRILTDWHNRTIVPTKFNDLAVAFKNAGLDTPYFEVAVKNKCLHFVPKGYIDSSMPKPPSYASVFSEKDSRVSVEETHSDQRTTVAVSVGAQPAEEKDEEMEETDAESLAGSFASMREEGDETESESSWERMSTPEESNLWNPEQNLPRYDSFEVDRLTNAVSQIELPSPESPFYQLMMNSFYNLRHTYTAHAVIINNCCDEFKGRNQFGDREPGRLEKSTDRHRDVLKTMGCKVDYGKDMKDNHISQFLHNLSRADFSDSNMFWMTVVAHGDDKGRLKDFNKLAVQDFTVDRIIEIACKNRSLVGKPKIFFFMACKGLEYDAGQQITLGGEGSVPRVLPTHADVLAAFPTWQGQVALFVPNSDNKGERMNAIEYLNDLLEPGKLPRPRRLATILRLWKRYHADSVFRTKHGNNVKQTPWVQDSLRDDVYV